MNATGLLATSVFMGLLATAVTAKTVVDKGAIRFTVGDEKAEHAVFVIEPRINSRHVIRFKIWRAAKPGATVTLRVDASKQPAYSTILTAEQCGTEKEIAVCSVTVPGRSKEADAIIAAFSGGQVLHVDVEHNGAMMMQESSSLDGFMAAFQRTNK